VLPQAKERKNSQDDHDQPYQIDQPVHAALPYVSSLVSDKHDFGRRFHDRQQADQVTAQAMRRRLFITLAAAVVLIGGGWLTLWATGGSSTVAPAPHPTAASAVSRRPSDELLETTKSLQVTQQQAVDQLQVVQDQLVAQQAEVKKLSEQIAALTERVDALQQSIANLPPTSRAAGSPSGPQPKAHRDPIGIPCHDSRKPSGASAA
jgi:uncharacterized coiled-coil protein SlyX